MNDFPAHGGAVEPRATHIYLPHRKDLTSGIWMGGTDSLLGTPIVPDELGSAIMVDCVGDLPLHFRERAAAYVPRVFLDVEAVPFGYDRLAELARTLAVKVGRDGATNNSAGLHAESVYILCQYGMNRSGLLTGLLLRALGEEADFALELIRRLRPGALSNQTYERLIRRWPLLTP